MKVVVFDLDDTLYEELTYVRSGFLAVADFLEQHFGIPQDESFCRMWGTLEAQGRGTVFNDVLAHYHLYNYQNVKRCVSVYRLHKPEIELLPDAIEVLQRLSEMPLYIVTDGNKVVQYNKLTALHLHEKMRKCYITHRYGIHHSKPSPYCFHQIAKREGVSPEEIVYIGDNPNKDFVGIKPFGYRTVRIMRGGFKELTMPEAFNAEYQIESLYELLPILNNT